MTGASLIRQIFRRRRGPMLAAAGCWALHQTCEAMVPVAIGLIIDHAVRTGDWTAMLVSLLGLFVLFAVLTMAYRSGAWLVRRAELLEAHDLRASAVSRVLSPGGIRTDRQSGDLLSITTTDADLTSGMIMVVPRMAGVAFGLVVSIATLLTIEWRLGLVIMIGVPLVALGLNALSPRIAHRTATQQREIGAAAALAADLLSGLRALRGFGGERVATGRYRQSSQRARQAAIGAARADATFQGVTALAGGLLLALVAAISGVFALRGEITVGELITIVGLGQFVAEPVNGLAFGVRMRARCAAGAERLAEILNAPLRVAGGDRILTPGPLVATGLAGAYVRDVSLVAAPDEIIGVVSDDLAVAGELGRQLAGTERPTAGQVTVADVALTEASSASRTSTLLSEPHRVELFGETLRSAITDGAADAAAVTDEEIGEVFRAAAAEQLLSEQGGLDRELDEGGSNLSGGQRQRAAFARALLADRPLLIMSDPTTAVDSVTEQQMATGLRRMRSGAGRTTVLVTASPPLLSLCDRVVFVRDGVDVRTGTHDQLLADDEFGAAYRAVVLR
ncbi:ABC transporter transmembrane domain-containing protein [Microlunatus soli]|uniref:Putative ABC transport system ATP-binding protein n=1 Tax=Microlunatus soli TaxID=630515 RepID=A0A1H1SVU4_9ACTN|nr:ABC transporter ATP-binding protein [Microlunatus soli]SDS52167.1 putative ABC transport system ATP-binding protein [Microlunatus soli]